MQGLLILQLQENSPFLMLAMWSFPISLIKISFKQCFIKSLICCQEFDTGVEIIIYIYLLYIYIYSVSDIFSFVQELKTADFSNKFMVSFDVVSLFTNIPLKESIDLAVSYIAEGNPNLKLSKNDLTKLSHLLNLKPTFFSMVKCMIK